MDIEHTKATWEYDWFINENTRVSEILKIEYDDNEVIK